MTNIELLPTEEQQQPTDSVLHRYGTNQEVFISDYNIVVLTTVTKETNSTIILPNCIGIVRGFDISSMPTVRVIFGVSVKIPVVIPHIDCLDEDMGEISDIATELITRTALPWDLEVDNADVSLNTTVRQGRVLISSRCLREIIKEH